MQYFVKLPITQEFKLNSNRKQGQKLSIRMQVYVVFRSEGLKVKNQKTSQ